MSRYCTLVYQDKNSTKQVIDGKLINTSRTSVFPFR